MILSRAAGRKRRSWDASFLRAASVLQAAARRSSLHHTHCLQPLFPWAASPVLPSWNSHGSPGRPSQRGILSINARKVVWKASGTRLKARSCCARVICLKLLTKLCRPILESRHACAMRSFEHQTHWLSAPPTCSGLPSLPKEHLPASRPWQVFGMGSVVDGLVRTSADPKAAARSKYLNSTDSSSRHPIPVPRALSPDF